MQRQERKGRCQRWVWGWGRHFLRLRDFEWSWELFSGKDTGEMLERGNNHCNKVLCCLDGDGQECTVQGVLSAAEGVAWRPHAGRPSGVLSGLSTLIPFCQ